MLAIKNPQFTELDVEPFNITVTFIIEACDNDKQHDNAIKIVFTEYRTCNVHL